MTRPNDKIHLIHATEAQGDYSGLTKREYFFLKILNGLLAGRLSPEWSAREFIQSAIEMTDDSIEQLNKQP